MKPHRYIKSVFIIMTVSLTIFACANKEAVEKVVAVEPVAEVTKVEAVTEVTATKSSELVFAKGGDISFIEEIEDGGYVYTENGEPKDPFEIFKDNG